MTDSPREKEGQVSETAKFVADTVKLSRASTMSVMEDNSHLINMLQRRAAPDPDAVPIRMPGTTPSPAANPFSVKKGNSHGPKPRNTLNAGFSSFSNQPPPPVPYSGPPFPPRPTPNVTPPTKRQYEAESTNERQDHKSKRQCISIANHAEVIDVSDNSDDDLAKKPKSMVVPNAHNSRRENPTMERLKTAVLNTEYPGSISEFTRVENRMGSKEYAKYRAVKQPIVAASTQNHSEVGYRVTARSGQAAKAAETTSHHWPSKVLSQSKSRDAFRDVNGQKRGSSPSEDELAIEQPSDHYTSVRSVISPEKVTSKATTISDSQEDYNEMEFEKDIPKTKFTNVPKSLSKPTSRRQAKKPDHSDCILNVTSVISNSFRHFNRPSEMIYESRDDQHDVFVLSIQDDDGFTKMGLVVPARAIHTVIWDAESPIVHLKCHKTFDNPNTAIDIEFMSADDCSQFVAIMEDRGNAQIKESDRETLYKIFQTSAKNFRDLIVKPLKVVGQEMTFLQEKEVLQRQVRSPQPAQSPTPKRQTLKERLNNQPNDRLKAMQSRVASKSSRTDKTSNELPTEEPISGKQDAEEDEISSLLTQGFRKRRNEAIDESPVPRTRRSLPRSGKQELDDFVVPDEPSPPLGYSKTHGLGQPWKKPLVYPLESKKKTTVEWSDLEKLDEGEYLNDNLLGFYLRYLEHKLESRHETSKVYWFNTYFYTSLTQNVKGKGRINYDAVRKWTRSVDLFSFDYVIVPINENHHWYLAIICNLPALKRAPISLAEDDEDMLDRGNTLEVEEVKGQNEGEDPITDVGIENEEDQDPPRREADPNEQLTRESFAEMQLDDAEKNPPSIAVIDAGDTETECKEQVTQSEVLTMVNSIDQKGKTLLGIADKKVEASPKPSKGKRKPKSDPDYPTIMILDSLSLAHPATVKILKMYLQEEANDKRGGMSWDEKAIRGMTAQEIPRQQNYWDCGLYVLGYASKFMGNPREFVVKMCNREYDIIKDWSHIDFSNMRNSTRDLIFELHHEQHPKSSVKSDTSPRVASTPVKQEVNPPIPPRKVENEVAKRVEGDSSSKPPKIEEASKKAQGQERPKQRVVEVPPLKQVEVEAPQEYIEIKTPPKPIEIEELTEKTHRCSTIIRASPDPPTTPKVHDGKAASQVISLDDSTLESAQPPSTPKLETLSPRKIPGAFVDDGVIIDDDEPPMVIPDSQEG